VRAAAAAMQDLLAGIWKRSHCRRFREYQDARLTRLEFSVSQLLSSGGSNSFMAYSVLHLSSIAQLQER
jgi:hypothetical protein